MRSKKVGIHFPWDPFPWDPFLNSSLIFGTMEIADDYFDFERFQKTLFKEAGCVGELDYQSDFNTVISKPAYIQLYNQLGFHRLTGSISIPWARHLTKMDSVKYQTVWKDSM